MQVKNLLIARLLLYSGFSQITVASHFISLKKIVFFWHQIPITLIGHLIEMCRYIFNNFVCNFLCPVLRPKFILLLFKVIPNDCGNFLLLVFKETICNNLFNILLQVPTQLLYEYSNNRNDIVIVNQ